MIARGDLAVSVPFGVLGEDSSSDGFGWLHHPLVMNLLGLHQVSLLGCVSLLNWSSLLGKGSSLGCMLLLLKGSSLLGCVLLLNGSVWGGIRRGAILGCLLVRLLRLLECLGDDGRSGLGGLAGGVGLLLLSFGHIVAQVMLVFMHVSLPFLHIILHLPLSIDVLGGEWFGHCGEIIGGG